MSSDGMPRIFWYIVAAPTALAIIMIIFLLVRGIQDGRRQVEAQRRQQIAIYLQMAEDARGANDPTGALDAYRKVLVLDPENTDAVDGIGSLLSTPQPQSTAAAVAVATPTPEVATPTPTSLNPLALVWADAQSLYNAGRWEDAIERLRQVRATDATFEADTVEEMLFTAYVSLATEKSNEGSLEEAVNLYDRALELRPNAVEIRSTRDVTAQYVDALTYWLADWPRVIDLLGDLYQRSPGYRDVRQRLQKAYLEYADSLARQSDWCTAADQYAAAIEVLNTPGLAEKQTEFETLCTQNPTATFTETVGTPAAAGPGITPDASSAAVGGLGTGRILYATADPIDGRWRVYAQPVTASVRPLVLVEDAMQPDLRADGARLVFRNMRGDQRGLGSYDPGSGLRLRFTNYAEDGMPSWNPEGNRLVFASDREGDRRWRIYTAWADGNDNGSGLGFGQDPMWSPTADQIVFRGCDEQGNGCGLWLMDSGGGNRVPLTNVPGDAHPEWSPDGRTVVFMSEERTGNWEIFRVDVASGAVIQLTSDPGIDGIPVVSPDGSRVAFLSNRGGEWKIWIKPITGGPEQPLAAITGGIPDLFVQKIQWVP
ncbi:MAG: hypothetical protein R2856_15440 [Caldilineaceae bacterium]